MLTEHYEQLREYVLARKGSSSLRWGQGALTARGMATWIQITGDSIPPLRSVSPPTSWDATNVPQLPHDDLIHFMGEVVMTLVTRKSL